MLIAGTDLFNMFLTVAIITSVLFVLIVFGNVNLEINVLKGVFNFVSLLFKPYNQLQQSNLYKNCTKYFQIVLIVLN